MLTGLCLLQLVSVQSLLFAHGASVKHSRSPETPIKYPGPINFHNQYGTGEPSSGVSVPDACKGQTFCTIKPPDYPQDKFDAMFRGYPQVPQISWVNPEDEIDYFDNRQGDPTEADGCASTISYEPLYQIRTRDSDVWRTVVQSPKENYVQKVRLETCRNTKKKCFTVAGDLGIETYCKQKFNVWEVLVSDGMNGTERVKAELPVCCSCVYRL